jgi:hypothetical protein
MVLNKTTLFVLPMLEIDATKSDYKSFLEGCYLKVKDFDFPKNHVALCYSQEPISMSGATDVFKFDDKIFVVYPIARIHLEDFDNFLKGKYSKFGTGLKGKIGIFYGFKSKFYKGVIREPALRKELESKIGVSLDSDAELISIYDEQDEFYK